jgi:putative tributyrin esterase
MRHILLVVLFLLSSAVAIAGDRQRLDSLFAPSVGRTMKYVVLLPAERDPGKRYPVLFLLHGLYGNHTDWTSRTRLAEYSGSLPILIVMPDAENSWYTNAWNDTLGRFEDFIARDLPSEVANKYGADTSCQAIAGLSMGGYGALKIGLKYPQKFFFAAGLSSAITVPREYDDRAKSNASGVMIESLRKAFGGGSTSFLAANDVLSLAGVVRGRLPFFYMVHGVGDGYTAFLPAHRVLAETFRSRNVPYEYHEVQGEHSWVFWDREIQPVLHRLMELLPSAK